MFLNFAGELLPGIIRWLNRAIGKPACRFDKKFNRAPRLEG
jgi:hypothetical protein